jgi:hypothetical protein
MCAVTCQTCRYVSGSAGRTGTFHSIILRMAKVGQGVPGDKRVMGALQLSGEELQADASAGVPLAASVAVASVGAFLAAHAVLSAAHTVGLGRHQRLGHGLHHGSQQIRIALLDLLRQPRGGVSTLLFTAIALCSFDLGLAT